jgi:putative membrane protein insertion efficiency factor
MKHPAPSSSQCPDCAGALHRLPRNAGRGLIWLYRHTLSPLVGYNCRHLPTCSVYGDEAIARFGLWGGGWMTLARLLRCQPWGTSGIDNVPLTKPEGARWYLPWRFGRLRGELRPQRRIDTLLPLGRANQCAGKPAIMNTIPAIST